MNERIKQLAIQAGMIVSESNGFDRIRLTFNEVEFAELIVRECASRVDNILREKFNGGGTMGDEIREHFGVEE